MEFFLSYFKAYLKANSQHTVNTVHSTEYSIAIQRPKQFYKTELICSLIMENFLLLYDLSWTSNKSDIYNLMLLILYIIKVEAMTHSICSYFYIPYKLSNEVCILLISLDCSFEERMKKSSLSYNWTLWLCFINPLSYWPRARSITCNYPDVVKLQLPWYLSHDDLAERRFSSIWKAIVLLH